MKIISLYVLAASILPCAALAQDQNSYLCSNGDLQRRIEIVRETDRAVPCEVHYYKDTEAPGEPQVLWRAQSEEGYCEEQARAFVAKLANWGWTCNAGALDADDSEEAIGADTATAEESGAA